MKFVDDAAQCWRWISMKMMVLGSALQATWMYTPDDMKASLPANWINGLTLAVLLIGILGRLVDQSPQPPLPPPPGKP